MAAAVCRILKRRAAYGDIRAPHLFSAKEVGHTFTVMMSSHSVV